MQQGFDGLPVLIAEDSADDLLLLQRALHKAGVRNPQILAATGSETIQYLNRAAAFGSADCLFPVVLFLDLVMPMVDGTAVLEWLRDQAHPPVSVVLHTGTEDDGLLRRAHDLGANFHLPKGARPEAISEVFRRAREEWEQMQPVQP